ncbi:MAG: serine/threonine protein kinase [Myxococcales bacterium]|nr:MAG: serine/threonine protein kinase [Myxococcales bacterium]
MSIEAGQVIDGKYRVVKLLGQGGMGAVYLAEHMIIGKRVALKVLLGTVAGNETAVARFEREAQAAARIGNDHILEIFDFGSLADGSRYMVCEFLEGETLAARVQRDVRMTPAAVTPLARQLLSGLGAAHNAGVVHRDLKPENIFILRQKAGLADFVKIIDFGISKFQPLTAAEGLQMTATGIVVGTPCYLSPEQARGSREADARSDLYAVGVILYECVTGQLPFNAQNVNDLLFKIVLESPRPLLEAAPDVDPAFARLIETAMAREPERRFQSAPAFIAALDKWAAECGVALPIRARGTSASGDGAVSAQSADVKLASGATRSLAPTPGTWADSKISIAAFQPQPRRRWLLPTLGATAGVLVVGLGFAFLKSGPTDGGGGAAASGAAPTSAAIEPTKRTEEQPAPSAREEVAPTPAADMMVVPLGTSDAPASPDLAPPKATPSPRPAVQQKRAVPAKKPVEAAAPVTPTPTPTPAPATAAKRRRDFGY